MSSIVIRKTAHGFTPKQVIRHNGTTWVTTRYIDAAPMHTRVVLASVDANHFLSADSGRVTLPAHGLTVGQAYYISDTTPGLLTTTRPSPLAQMIVYVEDANNLWISGEPKFPKRFPGSVLYRTAAGPAVPAAKTIVNFLTQQYDPNNLVTVGAAWVYTVPTAGIYHCHATVAAEGFTTASVFRMYLRHDANDWLLDKVEGVILSATLTIPTLSGGMSVQADKGALLHIVTEHNNPIGGVTLKTDALFNHVSIDLIAEYELS